MDFKKEELIKTPLNYTGGKYKLLPQILPYLPNNINTFYDLFCGGCDVGVNINKLKISKKVVCNDNLELLIKIYNCFKENTIEETYNYIFKTMELNNLNKENKEEYMKFREIFNNTENKYGLDFYILICHSFSNLIEFNSNGKYNVPFGKRTFNKHIQNRLKYFIEQCKEIEFKNESFDYFTSDKLNENDFIYCDPPYMITDIGYARNGSWSKEHDKKLFNYLDELNKNRIKFAMSNVLESKGKTNGELKEWSKKYKIIHLNNTYFNCNYQTNDRRKNSTDEVLIINY